MMKIGMDAGGTLIKAAYQQAGEAIGYRKFPTSRLQDAALWINGLDRAEICITGGKATVLKALLRHPSSEMVEFEATCRGVRHLLQESGSPQEAYVLTNVGTGTSIHYVDRKVQQRIGGTGVGGGTVMGLSQLLTGLTDYEEIVRLAAQGRRDRIDLKVSHIYEGAEPPIPGDLTASNFGRVHALASADLLSKEELLASVIGLVGETAATTSVFASAQCKVSTVVYIGSSFIRNPLLKDVVEGYTKLRGAEPIFIGNGEYGGAVGALLSLTTD